MTALYVPCSLERCCVNNSKAMAAEKRSLKCDFYWVTTFGLRPKKITDDRIGLNPSCVLDGLTSILNPPFHQKVTSPHVLFEQKGGGGGVLSEGIQRYPHQHNLLGASGLRVPGRATSVEVVLRKSVEC